MPGRAEAMEDAVGARAASPLDAAMERASAALVACKYFEAERACVHALHEARRANDFERMARIVLPLQEARRQKRQLALDAGVIYVVRDLRDVPKPARAGFYLICPPLIGLDARRVREQLDAAQVPAMVLAREPTTRAGQWPIVSVGDEVVVRTRVAPPEGGEDCLEAWARGAFAGERASAAHLAWFLAAGEALGDEAIARVKASEPAAHRVDDLLEFLSAFPDHEKLHQRLEEACRAAMREPVPERARRRPVVDDPYSF